MGSFLSSRANADDNWKSDARFAMESRVYCVICGGPFDTEGEVYNLDTKEPRYQWLFDYRLLGRRDDIHNHTYFEDHDDPVNTSEVDGIFLSEPAWFSFTGSLCFRVRNEARTDHIEYSGLRYSPRANYTLFPLHGGCIETSCRAINHHRSHGKDSSGEPALAVLFKLLNTRFFERHRAPPTHVTDDTEIDIFDLCVCSNLYGPRSVLSMTKLEWWGGEYDRFYTNPIDVPDLESFVFDVLMASSHNEASSTDLKLASREPEGIERLPVELLDAICSYLPPQSVIKLHRTSSLMASKIPLENAFWRDSLRGGCLHPHIWDLDIKQIEALRQESNITFSAAGWDWRSVAKLLAMKQFPVTGRDLRLEKMPLGLWNRCRIWSIIEEALDVTLGELSANNRNDSAIEVREPRFVVSAWDLDDDLETEAQ
ncbi:hypothetical protein EK21DRAFT_71444 [Setomelanomma holmii]|uniref:F-box domain-containing protein n=1 Tax=Setomelanomma holmii TaxID=210430 RepID=A0A9P4H5Y0_9PLEO|nr:hypothetical protein EK21DRAFT_71444 [Setomelanomma holmii]